VPRPHAVGHSQSHDAVIAARREAAVNALASIAGALDHNDAINGFVAFNLTLIIGISLPDDLIH
jgi:hypothetical protein